MHLKRSLISVVAIIVAACGNDLNIDSLDEVTQATHRKAPAAPSDLEATLSNGEVWLEFTDNSGNETGFYVSRSLNGSSFTRIATLSRGGRDCAPLDAPKEHNRSP